MPTFTILPFLDVSSVGISEDLKPPKQQRCGDLKFQSCYISTSNACYYSVQNLLFSRLLSKNLKIKIYRTIILPVVYMGVKPGH